MNLIEIIKRTAVDAVRQTYPLELLFATVTQDEDGGGLLIKTEQKQPLSRAFFIENGKLDGLKKGDRLSVLRLQGGQRFYVLEVLP